MMVDSAKPNTEDDEIREMQKRMGFSFKLDGTISNNAITHFLLKRSKFRVTRDFSMLLGLAAKMDRESPLLHVSTPLVIGANDGYVDCQSDMLVDDLFEPFNISQIKDVIKNDSIIVVRSYLPPTTDIVLSDIDSDVKQFVIVEVKSSSADFNAVLYSRIKGHDKFLQVVLRTNAVITMVMQGDTGIADVFGTDVVGIDKIKSSYTAPPRTAYTTPNYLSGGGHNSSIYGTRSSILDDIPFDDSFDHLLDSPNRNLANTSLPQSKTRPHPVISRPRTKREFVKDPFTPNAKFL